MYTLVTTEHLRYGVTAYYYDTYCSCIILIVYLLKACVCVYICMYVGGIILLLLRNYGYFFCFQIIKKDFW